MRAAPIEMGEQICYNFLVCLTSTPRPDAADHRRKGGGTMILTVDVGNSEITFGGFEGDELRFVAHLATQHRRTDDEYAMQFDGVLKLHGVDKKEITGAIISSVVPQLNRSLRRAIHFLFGVEALLVGPGIKTGLGIRCDNPSSVGADLICASVAAGNIYGVPCMIVDIGTATKMMVVDASGAFIGVSIIPGVLMGLNALSAGTAQLPSIDLAAPDRVIAKNTADCMKSGVVFGHASMIDGMIERIRKEFGAELPVYVTGGLAPVIIPHCRHSMQQDQLLVLRGLNIIYRKNN